MTTRRIIGIDSGLCRTGWGVIDVTGNRLQHVANGVLMTSVETGDLACRLAILYQGLIEVFKTYTPAEASVEQTFVNTNGASTLKLAHARGIALVVPALQGCSVSEYAPNRIKKSVVGVGHATKEQIQHMVRMLLPAVELKNADSADALAIAICHAYAGSGLWKQAV